MGIYKQQQIKEMEEAIYTQEVNGPFTESELERFKWEEEQYRADQEEMLQETQDSRELMTTELELAYGDMQEWQLTRQYSSECISNAQRRVSIVLKMIQGGRLW
jgi:hypothetical protein